MFKLQRLEITGFKSFADYTEIIFTGDGITAIVGPNGCGKSNVADAIAWVLGEQRVKHLRGGEMKDVIFQGSRNRQPSGMAEVVMHMVRDEVDESSRTSKTSIRRSSRSTIDSLTRRDSAAGNLLNPSQPKQHCESRVAEAVAKPPRIKTCCDTAAPPSHKRHWRRRNLALEFAPGEAVSVTRRLYRSGESEYLLNDRFAGCAIFRISSRDRVSPAVTTPSSNRAASDRFFPPSRWTAARSSKRRPASPSFACASERPKRVSNLPAPISRASPTSFPKSIDR
jgi:chromosome segregation protein